jgi:hypothetical protein
MLIAGGGIGFGLGTAKTKPTNITGEEVTIYEGEQDTGILGALGGGIGSITQFITPFLSLLLLSKLFSGFGQQQQSPLPIGYGSSPIIIIEDDE